MESRSSFPLFFFFLSVPFFILLSTDSLVIFRITRHLRFTPSICTHKMLKRHHFDSWPYSAFPISCYFIVSLAFICISHDVLRMASFFLPSLRYGNLSCFTHEISHKQATRSSPLSLTHCYLCILSLSLLLFSPTFWPPMSLFWDWPVSQGCSVLYGARKYSHTTPQACKWIVRGQDQAWKARHSEVQGRMVLLHCLS